MDSDRVEELEREIFELKFELESIKARNAAMITVGMELRTELTTALGCTKLLIRRSADIKPTLLADALDILHSHLQKALHQVCML